MSFSDFWDFCSLRFALKAFARANPAMLARRLQAGRRISRPYSELWRC
jgi:hypothetical protein